MFDTPSVYEGMGLLLFDVWFFVVCLVYDSQVVLVLVWLVVVVVQIVVILGISFACS